MADNGRNPPVDDNWVELEYLFGSLPPTKLDRDFCSEQTHPGFPPLQEIKTNPGFPPAHFPEMANTEPDLTPIAAAVCKTG